MDRILIQGPTHKDLTSVVESVLSWSNNLPIVLSTWGKVDYEHEKVQILSLEDPGPGPIQNYKRQVIGLRRGLRLFQDNDIVLKIRSDIITPVNPFLFWLKEPCNDIFDYKVGISKIMTRRPDKFPWFISDWIWLGTCRDLKRIASVDPDTSTIISNACEATWAYKLYCEYSKTKDYRSFLFENYQVLRTKGDLQMTCLKYPNKIDNDHLYIQ